MFMGVNLPKMLNQQCLVRERWAVMAAANQCLHAADASISPTDS
jgi:hypothetical protein